MSEFYRMQKLAGIPITEMRVNEPSSLIFKKENEDEIIYIDKKNNVEYYGNILDEDKALMFTIPIDNEPEIMAGYSDENIMDAIESENPDFNINGLRSFISKLKQYKIPILEFYTDSEGGGIFVWVMIILNLNDIKKYIINYSNRSINEMRVNKPNAFLPITYFDEDEGDILFNVDNYIKNIRRLFLPISKELNISDKAFLQKMLTSYLNEILTDAWPADYDNINRDQFLDDMKGYIEFHIKRNGGIDDLYEPFVKLSDIFK